VRHPVSVEHYLNVAQHAPSTLALANTANFLSKQDMIAFPEFGEDVIIDLTHEQELLKLEIEGVSDRVTSLKEELEEIWKDDVEAAYELTSVFIHRGSSPSWGHYFFYSRHLPDHPDSWFKYNDSDVTVVSKEEVLADTTGSTANPYLVCGYLLALRMTLIIG
jgi:ubiquitin carboxyl-terminal hydrolase 25/28